MDRKMIFVLLLSGYIFTKPVATQTSGTSGTLDSPAKPATSPGPTVNAPPEGQIPVLEHSLSQSVTVVIIFAVIAAVIGIIIGCASLIFLLRRRYREQTSAPKTSEQVQEIEDSAP
uniref:Glycophorin-A n=1 Tax=Capra hircus TaxID=9925 RepID=A0A452FHU2_CAPHI